MKKWIMITTALLSAACGSSMNAETKTAMDAKDAEIAELKRQRVKDQDKIHTYVQVINRQSRTETKTASEAPARETAKAPEAPPAPTSLVATPAPTPERATTLLPRVVPYLPPSHRGGILPLIGFMDEDPCSDNSVERALGGWDIRPRDLRGLCLNIYGSRYGILIEVDTVEMEARYVSGVPQSTCVDFRGERRYVPMSLPNQATRTVLTPGRHVIRYHVFQEPIVGDCWTHVRTTRETVTFPVRDRYYEHFRPEQARND